MRQPISLGKVWLKLAFSLLNQIYLPSLISHYLPGEITPIPFLHNSSLEHWSLLLSILLQSEHIWFLKFPWSPQGNIQGVLEAEGWSRLQAQEWTRWMGDGSSSCQVSYLCPLDTHCHFPTSTAFWGKFLWLSAECFSLVMKANSKYQEINFSGATLNQG